MKVALVFPRFSYPTGDPPLGVAYLAATIRETFGESPAVIDSTFAPDPERFIEAELKKNKYDLVGVSAMVTMSRHAALTARLAKAANPDCLVIAGGPHPTTLPAETLSEPAVDAVCVGEGEQSLIEVLKKGSVDGVAGIFVRDGDGIAGLPRDPIGDLDALPFPALDLLAMEDYFSSWFQLDTAAPGIRGTSVLATRGCPFRCSYCQPTLDKLFGRGVRKRSAANVVDELAERKDRFGIGGFIFADDTFIADRRWVSAFCEELNGRGLGLTWGCNVRADLVDEELLTEMRKAGLGKIYIGIEVFDDERRREVFNKRLTREHVELAARSARKLGIGAQGYFMLGAPGESRSDVWDTVRYAWDLPIDDATFNLTTPLPGTYLYEKHREQLADQRWLNRMQFIAYAGFYSRPRRLLRQVGSLFKPGGAGRFLGKLRRVI